MILKARGPGKFCSSRTAGVKVGKIDKFFTKVSSGERYPNFLGPAGGSRTWKGAFAFQNNTIWLVETEIAFSVEEQHFIGTTAGRKSKISRLKIILFRGDVSVFGVVIHIARHSIGIKNTTHSLALYYSWEFCLLANSFLIQTVESTSEISLMDQHEISEVDPK